MKKYRVPLYRISEQGIKKVREEIIVSETPLGAISTGGKRYHIASDFIKKGVNINYKLINPFIKRSDLNSHNVIFPEKVKKEIDRVKLGLPLEDPNEIKLIKSNRKRK